MQTETIDTGAAAAHREISLAENAPVRLLYFSEGSGLA